MGALLVSVIAIAAFGPALFRALDALDWPLWLSGGVTVLLTLAAAVAALTAPGRAFRHIDTYKFVVIAAVVALIAAGVVALTAVWQDRWDPVTRNFRLVGAGLLAGGVVLGLVIDGLNRQASRIPTTVGGLLLVIVLIAGFGAAKANER